MEGTQVLVPLKIIGKTVCTGACTLRGEEVLLRRGLQRSPLGGPLSGPEAYRSVKNTQHYTTQAAPLMSLRARSAKLCAQTAVFLWQGERHR